MNTLLTAHQFLPDSASGTEVLTLGVDRELRHREHNVKIFTGFPGVRELTDHERFDSYKYVETIENVCTDLNGKKALL